MRRGGALTRGCLAVAPKFANPNCGSVAEPGLLRRIYNPRERVNARSEGPNPSGPAHIITGQTLRANLNQDPPTRFLLRAAHALHFAQTFQPTQYRMRGVVIDRRLMIAGIFGCRECFWRSRDTCFGRKCG